jgi:hypothetical protein
MFRAFMLSAIHSSDDMSSRAMSKNSERQFVTESCEKHVVLLMMFFDFVGDYWWEHW